MKEVTNSPQKTFLTVSYSFLIDNSNDFLQSESLTQEQEGGKQLHRLIYFNCLIIIEYIQAFILFDRDEDGLINPKELSLLIRSLECNPTDQEIQQLVDQIVEEG